MRKLICFVCSVLCAVTVLLPLMDTSVCAAEDKGLAFTSHLRAQK